MGTLGLLVMATAGLFLSAFFSGMETGFYRATRAKLVLDAKGGDHVARGLVWLTNHASLFVATTLVGNNLANYLTSLAIVIGTQALIQSEGHTAELLAPLMLAPVLFVYGELLPKNLFLQAPNRLLRRGGPVFLGFLVISFPISVILWGLSRLLARLVGESPEEVRLTLARRELQKVLEEGHEAGIIHPAQWRLAGRLFAEAKQPISQFVRPLTQLPRARSGMNKEDVLGLARRYQISVVPVEAPGGDGGPVGYVRVIELGLSGSDEVGPVHRLLEIPESITHLNALTRMQTADESLAAVVDSRGEMIGIVTADALREPLLGSGRRS